jgi:hypothetical protein
VAAQPDSLEKQTFDDIIAAVCKCSAKDCSPLQFFNQLSGRVTTKKVSLAAKFIENLQLLNNLGFQTIKSGNAGFKQQKMQRGSNRNNLLSWTANNGGSLGPLLEEAFKPSLFTGLHLWDQFAFVKGDFSPCFLFRNPTGILGYADQVTVAHDKSEILYRSVHPWNPCPAFEPVFSVPKASLLSIASEGRFVIAVHELDHDKSKPQTAEFYLTVIDSPSMYRVHSYNEDLGDEIEYCTVYWGRKPLACAYCLKKSRLWAVSEDLRFLMCAEIGNSLQSKLRKKFDREHDLQRGVFARVEKVRENFGSAQLHSTDQHLLFAVVFTNREGKNKLAHIAVDIDDPLKCVASMTIKKSWTVGSCFYMRSASNHAMHVAVSKAHNSFQVVAWSRSKFLMIIDLHHSRGMIRELQGNEIGRPAVGYDCSEKCLAVSFFPKRGYPICHLYPLKM